MIALASISRSPVIASSASGHGLARAHREHRAQRFAGVLVPVDRAAVERAGVGRPPCRARGGTGTGARARGSSACTDVLPGCGTWRPDRSRLAARRPAARCPDTSRAAPTRPALYCVGLDLRRRRRPSATCRSERPNGRNATFSSARLHQLRGCRLAGLGTFVEEADLLQVGPASPTARGCRRSPRGSRRWRRAGTAVGCLR